jgi:MarR family transcriptional regulator, organic hydroperoxide resistance regulator
MSVEECIFYQLAKTNQAGNKVWKKAMSGFNVTATQGIILNFLYDRDRITSKELGERTLLDSATLTGILDRLEKAGLIERLQHPTDRRSIIIGLTTQGRKVAAETYKEIERANEIFLKVLDDEEQKSFRTLLRSVRDYSDKALADIGHD